MLVRPHRVGGYPKYAEGSFPLLVLFDDSLHRRWYSPLKYRQAGPSDVPLELDAAVEGTCCDAAEHPQGKACLILGLHVPHGSSHKFALCLCRAA